MKTEKSQKGQKGQDNERGRLSVSVPARIAMLPVRAYKRFVSPLLPGACRFHPTCSEYCIEALARHGLFKGLCLGLRRIARCHPFCRGGVDPVP